MDGSKTALIGTHNGCFHADELVACTLLKKLPEYTKASIIRTRDEAKLNDCNVVVDVGGIFDASRNRFDHHQREFNLTLKDFIPNSKWDIKLSSAGLIYVHFGHRVLAEMAQVSETDPMVSVLFDKLYSVFISEIDAIDNGVSICSTSNRYSINTGLSTRVSRLNPPWNKPFKNEEECFHKALAMVQAEFTDLVDYYLNTWYPARHLVEAAFGKRHEVDSSGTIFIIDDTRCPWASTLHELERAEFAKLNKPLLDWDLTVPDSTKNRPVFCVCLRTDSTWSATAIARTESDRFNNRLLLPEPWRGLRDEQLSNVAGFDACVFVHASGFLGVHKTKDGALRMARIALKQHGLIDDSN